MSALAVTLTTDELAELVRRAVRAELDARAGSAAPAAPAPVLTPAQVAAELGCSIRTVREWIATGELVAFHVGRHLRVTAGELAAFVAARRTGRARSGRVTERDVAQAAARVLRMPERKR